jgi:hypothetical protein
MDILGWFIFLSGFIGILPVQAFYFFWTNSAAQCGVSIATRYRPAKHKQES